MKQRILHWQVYVGSTFYTSPYPIDGGGFAKTMEIVADFAGDLDRTGGPVIERQLRAWLARIQRDGLTQFPVVNVGWSWGSGRAHMYELRSARRRPVHDCNCHTYLGNPVSTEIAPHMGTRDSSACSYCLRRWAAVDTLSLEELLPWKPSV